jgi:hypothetical protein
VQWLFSSEEETPTEVIKMSNNGRKRTNTGNNYFNEYGWLTLCMLKIPAYEPFIIFVRKPYESRNYT